MRPRAPVRYLQRHAQAGIAALGELSRQRMGTLLAALVLGITLALPVLLLLGLETLAGASAGWDGRPRLSVFLRLEVTDGRAGALAAQLRAWREVRAVEVITRAQALAEFSASSGLGELFALADDNPLPATLVVTPAGAHADADAVGALARRLRALPEAARVQADLAWVARLHALLDLGRRAVALLATLLGLGVVLVTGNTIRLAILSRREEIEIVKLVGGSDAFVRRPFLYSGLLQGLAGGIVALALVLLAGALLAPPLAELGRSYGTALSFAGLGARRAALLLLVAGTLGLAGAWLAVGRHLKAIELR